MVTTKARRFAFLVAVTALAAGGMSLPATAFADSRDPKVPDYCHWQMTDEGENVCYYPYGGKYDRAHGGHVETGEGAPRGAGEEPPGADTGNVESPAEGDAGTGQAEPNDDPGADTGNVESPAEGDAGTGQAEPNDDPGADTGNVESPAEGDAGTGQAGPGDDVDYGIYTPSDDNSGPVVN
ncbi:hypothetical protein ABZ446_34285 [Streptomyces sp. NPDC005813]|uniref:hypothetical protein n=1 Tax=Streptomyces sp. NPDC005813 TaxID=3155592 RepID=UPI0033C5FB28